jgi:hypothetical protein
MKVSLAIAALRNAACALGMLAAATAAGAHDTWFQPLGAGTGPALLALGTGNAFPQHEVGVGAEYLRESGCRGADQRPVAMTAVLNLPRALLLRAAANDVATCWAQLAPLEIELPSETVQIYLDEINAPQALRDAWTAMHSRGVRWKERYTKHARVELQAGSTVPTGMAMDVLLESDLRAIGPGDPLVFQVLRDGRPLAGFSLELRGEQAARWHKTDAHGRVRLDAPQPGRWLLRGTELRLADGDRWESRFVTLAFEVRARPGS